ncbi:hypothetical protein AAFC00_002069 [Neodothiora populina]|uniref:FAD-binding domain-containing protein n=1 Tax=Neodothiora populina TaxID=2781224 RepID=A0ABR3PG68_9PEZI
MTTKHNLGSIAIVGGGISGVCLGIALLQRGIKVEIFEQAVTFGEIGAGVAFNPAAVRAMKKCSEDVFQAFDKVATVNGWPEKKTTWFDWVDGYNDTEIAKEQWHFTLSNEIGANGVHRAHFLDNLVKAVPEGVTHFNKHLDTIIEHDNGKLTLRFHDGVTHEADAVIGCDGIKSKVRAWMMGPDSPCTQPTYTHKYAYRGLIPMDKARKELGDDLGQNAKMHMGQDGHVLTFPVDKGRTMNVVAFKVDPGEWPSATRLTLPTTKEDAKRDFKDFGVTVNRIIDLLEPNLDRWAIFDTGKHPMPYYNKGKVVVLGDAGHATSPHHGSGAGMCIEDAAIMAELLADPRVEEHGDKGFKAAFEAYSKQRLERTQWLVQSSARSGNLYEWRPEPEGRGRDLKGIENECRERCDKIWNGDLTEYIAEAKELLGQALSSREKL